MTRATIAFVIGLVPTIAAGRAAVGTPPRALATGPAAIAPAVTAGIDRSVDSLMRALRIPGLSLALYRGGAEWQKGYGLANLEHRVPATPATSYVLASLMKLMTAVAVLQLVSAGKVDLDSTIQKYVSAYPAKPWPVTVRQVLGHLAGIGCRDFDWTPGIDTVAYDTPRVLALFKDCDLLFEPGTRFEYSSWGYDLLGALIEEVSGATFGDYMRRHVWGPLGMDRTGLDTRAMVDGRASGYDLQDSVLVNSRFVDNSLWFAAGGGRSTVLDLMRFSRGLDAGTVLDPSLQRLMYTSMSTRDGKPTRYGMGWGVMSVAGETAVYWMGSQPGTTTVLVRVPERRIAVALMCNLGDRPMQVFPVALGCVKVLMR